MFSECSCHSVQALKVLCTIKLYDSCIVTDNQIFHLKFESDRCEGNRASGSNYQLVLSYNG